MKRLLVVMLLLLGVSAFVSCNSYDVEGKPEIASNPAKVVFDYDPWNRANTDKQGNDTENPGETDPEETTDSEVTDPETTDTEVTENETPDDAEEEQPSTDEENNEENNDGEPEDSIGEGAVYVVKAANNENIGQVDIEIYNRGVTGELKIRKINVLDSQQDPDTKQYKIIDETSSKGLFKIAIQNMNNGMAAEGFGSEDFTFDFMNEDKGNAIAPLCPLKLDSTEKVCKKDSDKGKLNTAFKIRLTMDKDTVLKTTNNGDFWLEICTNDPTKGKTPTCGDNATSYRIQVRRQPLKPNKPIIKVEFKDPISQPMSYRNIYDKVRMSLSKTCVARSDREGETECLENWKDQYYIRYKWEMVESPTPLIEGSRLKMSNMDATSGQWISDNGKDDPTQAEFTGYMITPRKYYEDNETKNAEECQKCGTEPIFNKDDQDDFYFLKLSDYLICRQKYCEENRTKYYKVNIQAETVDKSTDLSSDTAEVTVIPKIIPQARVVAQLTWKQGFKTKAESEAQNKEGAAIDLDIHMIKKSSLEAAQYGFTSSEGLLGTKARTVDCPSSEPSCEVYWRHDDCSFGDPGNAKDGTSIEWNASLDIDNTWGGNNYETPETIGLGPIIDNDNDGRPDKDIYDDQYLIVVGYVGCVSKYPGEDRCASNYFGEDAVYEVDGRVEIFIDGVEVPRKVAGSRPADSYHTETKNFKIKVNQWKVLTVVKWDNSLPGPESNPKYPGDAIVQDIAYTSLGIETDSIRHPVCTYDNSDAVLIPIWDAATYKSYIETPDEEGRVLGTCETPNPQYGGNDNNPDTGDTDSGDSDSADSESDTGADSDNSDSDSNP